MLCRSLAIQLGRRSSRFVGQISILVLEGYCGSNSRLSPLTDIFWSRLYIFAVELVVVYLLLFLFPSNREGECVLTFLGNIRGQSDVVMKHPIWLRASTPPPRKAASPTGVIPLGPVKLGSRSYGML